MDELLIKYLANELSEEEKILVRNWINDSDQNANYFEELKRTWELIDVDHSMEKINIDNEWEHFRKKRSTGYLKVVAGEKASEFEKTIFSDAGFKKRTVREIVLASAIAASVLLILWVGKNMLLNTGVEKELVTKTNNKIDGKYSGVVIRKEVNSSVTPKKIQLEDGSEIVLYENSEVSFEERFPDNKRDIQLSGKADFTVAKNKTKPFTVYSGEVATTALGTKFTVTSYKKENKIVVRLYEGKVVVKSSVENLKKLPRDYLLMPGNELVYNKAKANATLRLFKTVTPAVNKAKGNQILIAEDPSFPKDTPGTWFMFNNQSLDQVLDQLALMFDRKIIYSKKEMHKIYFIGKFDKSDDLESILEQIATLNGLKLTRKNENFLIRKND